jgi:hypothetical protein
MQKEGGQAVSRQLQMFFALIFGFAILLCVVVGAYIGEHTIKQEAVNKGYAEWVVDLSGRNCFKWKECK